MRYAAPSSTARTTGAVSNSRSRTGSSGAAVPAPSAPAADATRSADHRNHPIPTRASAEVAYCRYMASGRSPTTVLSAGSKRVPQRPGWVKASQTTWDTEPSTAEATNQPADAARSRTGPGVRGRPRTNAPSRSRAARGNSARSGSRTSSQPPTSPAVSSTSTVSTPGRECVNAPNVMPPGTTVPA
ncbi:hypothetical protein AOB60_14675 [Streptomyces noursei]|uniref:Uncharacterized protein n=1 Tax=Streptomyces noursei TaxID=1971 RepID=A0A2N8PLD7_STRNR|nr:hypothetical protein AOB60_14675 [Streptomyces noursei]